MFNSGRVKQLLLDVPQPPHVAPISGATELQIKAFEDRTGLTIPNALKEWFRLANGPYLNEHFALSVYSETTESGIERVLVSYPEWKERNWLPIIGDSFGNFYVVSTSGDFRNSFPVLFIDTAENTGSAAFVAASNPSVFLELLLEKESGKTTQWLFDERFIRSRDPDIAQFQKLTLPWDA